MRSANEGLSRLLGVLDRMEIAYIIGGSVASSSHGVPRTTLDVDVIVDLQRNRINEFVTQLSGDFYADADLVHDSFRRGRAANLIHLASGWKFDLFPLRPDEYSRTEFSRRIYRTVSPDGGPPIECAIASAEDTIIRKLEWYRSGGQTSERQWNDLIGVCRTVGNRLDMVYLRSWAKHVGVNDLLDQLLDESRYPVDI